MSVSKEQAWDLLEQILAVCVDVAKSAHCYIGTHDMKRITFLLNEYPVSSTDIFFSDNNKFSEKDREKIPFLKYKIPKYKMGSFPSDKKYYPGVFDSYSGDSIKLTEIKEIDNIKEWINSEKDILKCFTKNETLSDYVVRAIIRDVVERYLFMTNASEIIPDDIEELIRPYLIEKLRFYLDDYLPFDICIPICLTTFEKEIELDENVKIIKISDDLQIARQVACQYEVFKEDWVAACATHMIIIEGYRYPKESDNTFNSIMEDYRCYPIDRINEIMGIIRVATGFDIGYESIFCIPNNWVYDTVADLVPVYGAKAHFVNPKYFTKDWMSLPISFITKEQCDEIANLYSDYKNNADKLRFSLERLNRCLLRDAIDDMTTDACIGLESLLSGNAHTEINNAISSRIPFVLAAEKVEKYPVTKGRKYMKAIYNLRSRIVHGGNLKEKDLYQIEEKGKIHVPDMAVDFLRITLLFMIKNPNYLNVEEIDSYIDSLFEKEENDEAMI